MDAWSPQNFRIDVGGGAGAFATLVVAPGAGVGFDHPFLVGFTQALNDQGATRDEVD